MLPQRTVPPLQSSHSQVSTVTENEREGSLGLADLLEAVATHKNLRSVRLHAIHCHVRLPDLARYQHLDLLLLACQLGGLQNSRILESPTSSTKGQPCHSSQQLTLLQTAPRVEQAQAARLCTHCKFSLSTQNCKLSPGAVPCYCNLAR